MNEFKKVIDEMTETFRSLSTLAQIKLNAATKNRVATIEECMGKEQSLTLKLRGLEQKRDQEQKRLGFENKKFQEILADISEEERRVLVPSFELLSREIQIFQSINNDLSKVIKVNLRQIEKSIEERYGKEKSESIKKDGRFTNKSI